MRAHDIQEEMKAFGKALDELRSVVGQHPPETIKKPEDELPRVLAFGTLFRTLNLGRSLVACAERREYETVGLIGRSLLELLFLVKAMGRGFNSAHAFLNWSTRKHDSELRKLRDFVSRMGSEGGISYEDLDVLLESSDLGENADENNWKQNVAEVAKKANMEREYRYHYPLWCLESHHRARALLTYCRPDASGYELCFEYPEDKAVTYCGIAMMYCVELMGLLVEECGIANSAGLAKAIRALASRYSCRSSRNENDGR